MMQSVPNRAWRAYAGTRRVLTRSGSASAALDAVDGGRRRAAGAEWSARLAARHDAYRRAVNPLPDGVAIVCVSRRPHLLDAVVAAVAWQTHHVREFVLVTNSEGFGSVDIEAALAPLRGEVTRAVVLKRPSTRSLGACLNDAIDFTSARFVAKFDDDDLYGPEFLADAMRAHSYAGAAIVGKHTYYAHVAADDLTVLRFPAHEFRYSSTLAGGTLVIDRERLGDVRFPDISLGEDRALIAACHRRGVSTFSADRFNFTQVRSGDNTWSIEAHEFLRRTVPAGSGLDLSSINR